MKGRNMEFLWDALGGKYLTNRFLVCEALGIGHERANELLEGIEVMALGKSKYLRTMDVIERIERSFVKI
jgi:hypothetical protein